MSRLALLLLPPNRVLAVVGLCPDKTGRPHSRPTIEPVCFSPLCLFPAEGLHFEAERRVPVRQRLPAKDPRGQEPMEAAGNMASPRNRFSSVAFWAPLIFLSSLSPHPHPFCLPGSVLMPKQTICPTNSECLPPAFKTQVSSPYESKGNLESWPSLVFLMGGAGF